VTDPAATPVTTPALVTVAIVVLLLVHVPPEVGLKVVVMPTHIDDGPETLIVGFAFTVTFDVGFDTHPLDELVNVKLAVPVEIPVTKPLLLTVATVGLLLVHVPPVVGERLVVFPIQTVLEPLILVGVKAFTKTVVCLTSSHPLMSKIETEYTVFETGFTVMNFV
jgi:hypothetical protein